MKRLIRLALAAAVVATPGVALAWVNTGHWFIGEAAIAVNYAKHHLDPSANIFPGHSSNMK